jgi:hypothetical protein
MLHRWDSDGFGMAGLCAFPRGTPKPIPDSRGTAAREVSMKKFGASALALTLIAVAATYQKKKAP